MNCQEAQDLIRLGLYGSLAREHEQALREHLAACPACRRLAERIEPHGLAEPADPPELDMEASWPAILGRMQPERKRRKPVRTIRFALAGAAAVFALGIFVGRSLLPIKPANVRCESNGPT